MEMFPGNYMNKIYSFFKFLESKTGQRPPLRLLLEHEPDNIVSPEGEIPSINLPKCSRELTSVEILRLSRILIKEKRLVVKGPLVLFQNNSKDSTAQLLEVFYKIPNVVVEGPLILSSITEYPVNITALSDITVTSNKNYGKILPDNTTVSGTLSIKYSKGQLPADLHVKGNLVLEDLPAISFLPGGLKVEGDFIIGPGVPFINHVRGMKSVQKREFVNTILKERGGYLKGNLIN